MDDIKGALKGMTILVVDDNPENINILRQALEMEGYKISVATSGEAVLKIASVTHPDLILMDVMMPGMNGFDTCKHLKANMDTQNIPVMFITAKNEIDDIVKGFAVGGVDYISKPYKHEELFARVSIHLYQTYLDNELKVKNNELFRLIALGNKNIEELRVANEKLAELNDLKNEFIGMASHDMRGALSLIQGFSKILVDERKVLDEASQVEFLEIIQTKSSDLLSLVNDVLNVAVIDSGKLELNKERTPIKEFLQKHIHLSKIKAQKKSIIIHEEFADTPVCFIDKNRMGLVIDNLIDNAIKYSPAGKNIFIGLKNVGNMAEISIKDEGQGIPAWEQTKLFRNFQKLSPRPTAGEPSTGLGLAIAKKMIEAHNGTIGVESESGVGSTFFLNIPLVL